MSPPEIFDYLEGRLSEEARAELQLRIAAEPALQKDLEAAREMERGFAALRKATPPADLLDRTRWQINAAKSVVNEAAGGGRTFPSWAWPVAAAAIVLLGVGGIFLHERNTDLVRITTASAPSDPEPNRPDAPARDATVADLGDLRTSLVRTAEKNLPTPILASEQIELPSAQSELIARAEEVIRLAAEAGGSALKSDSAPGEQRVLASIPQDQMESFRRAIDRVSEREIDRPAKLGTDKLAVAVPTDGRKMLSERAEKKPAEKAKALAKKKEQTDEDAGGAQRQRLGLARQKPIPSSAPAAANASGSEVTKLEREAARPLALAPMAFRSADAPPTPNAPKPAAPAESAARKSAAFYSFEKDAVAQPVAPPGLVAGKGAKSAPADGQRADTRAPSPGTSALPVSEAADRSRTASQLHTSEMSSRELSQGDFASSPPVRLKDAPVVGKELRASGEIAEAKKRQAPEPVARQLIEIIIRPAH